MKGKQIIIALIVLALLGGYFYYFDIVKKKKDYDIKMQDEMLFYGFKKDDIATLIVTNRDAKSKIVIKKVGNDLMIDEPIKAYVDEVGVSGIFEKYQGLIADRKIDSFTAQDLADFDLNTPFATTELITKDNKDYKVNIGAYNPEKTLVYAMKPEDPKTVYLLDRNIRIYAEKTLFDYRDKTPIRIDMSKTTKVVMKLKDKDYELDLVKPAAKDDPDAWRVSGAVNDVGKIERIRDIFNNLKGAKAKKMEPITPENLKKYGLNNPKEYITFYEGNTKNSIYFGMEDKKAGSVYIKSDTLDQIMEIPSFAYSGMPAIWEVVNKQLVFFRQDKVRKVEIRYRDVEIEADDVEKSKDNYVWTINKAKNVDKSKVNITSALAGLYWCNYQTKIEGKLSPDEEAKLYGIDTKNPFMKIWGEKGAYIATLLLGKKVEGKEQYYIKVPERNTIFAVDTGALKNFNLPDFPEKQKPQPTPVK